MKPKSPEKSKPEDKDPDKSPTKKQEGSYTFDLLSWLERGLPWQVASLGDSRSNGCLRVEGLPRIRATQGNIALGPDKPLPFLLPP